jgi:4-amino-4-deoxy-L-arabinose transferase-like glycosyltransferase
LVLALVFANLTPYRTGGVLLSQRGAPAQDIGAPDERQHVNYVARLAEGRGLPVFDPKDPNLYESYQSHQPPLFYGVAMVWSKLLGVSDFTVKDAGVRLRSVNAVIGAAGVAGVFFLALWGLSDRREHHESGSLSPHLVASLASAFAALLPMNVALSGAVSNDPLLIALSTWALALLVRGVREGWTVPISLGAGSLTALAILTKTTGVALLPVLLAAALLRKPSLPQFGTVVAPLLLLVLPWWGRNLSLYGDPLAVGAFNQAFTGSPQASAFIEQLGPTTYWTEWVGWWTARSFVGVFGYMDIWLTNTGLPGGANGLYQIVLLVLGAGLAVALVTAPRDGAPLRSLHVLNAIFAAIVLILFLRFNMQYFQAQARYLMPALGPIAIGCALGWMRLLKGRPNLAMVVVLVPLLLADGLAISRLPSEFDRRTAVPPAGNAG